jgi:hypothetical protein
MSHASAWLGMVLRHYRATFVIALMVALVSSGTAAAVSYLVLGTTNTAGATTTLNSGVNGPVLQLTNTNTGGGTKVRGLGINVPAGRAPIKVSAGAGKATNLDADKLDGLDSTKFARGTNVTTVANRLVLANGDPVVVLLGLPGLGRLEGICQADGSDTTIYWRNTTSATIDIWVNTYTDARLRAFIAAPFSTYLVAEWDAPPQLGDTLVLGYGYPPNPRRTATVTATAYRSVAGAPCGLQATATVWSAP